MRKSLVAAGASLLIACSACGAQADGKAAVKPGGPPSARAYSSVVELRDAAVAGGYPCDSWEQTDVVTTAAESGNCADDDVFATYATDEDLQQNLSAKRQFAKDNGFDADPTVRDLIGKRWTITGPTKRMRALQTKLGGTLSK